MRGVSRRLKEAAAMRGALVQVRHGGACAGACEARVMRLFLQQRAISLCECEAAQCNASATRGAQCAQMAGPARLRPSACAARQREPPHAVIARQRGVVP